jgi:hypothetical protein
MKSEQVDNIIDAVMALVPIEKQDDAKTLLLTLKSAAEEVQVLPPPADALPPVAAAPVETPAPIEKIPVIHRDEPRPPYDGALAGHKRREAPEIPILKAWAPTGPSTSQG